jgi:S1-C subfamily serine protease
MRNLSRWVPVVGGAIAGGIIALVIASSGHHNSNRSVTTTVVQSGSGTSEPTSFARSGSSGMSINQIYQQDGPGVVDILVKSKSSGSSSNSLFGGSQVQEGEGAGVVYNDQGYILTDEHVVAGALKVVVTFQNGTKVPAKVIGSDASSDVGVIKVNVPSSELHPIKFANSDSAEVGDPVVAIGSPFSLPETVTAGIVSQTQRTIQAPNGYYIPDAVQTDAAINPGNSGGPLLNADGQVLGLNDQIETDSQNSATGEGQNAGIGFATPSNEDQRIAGQIIAGKTVQHAFLGIATASPTGANLLSTQKSNGVTITKVEAQGPAAKAGLEVDDVITKINGVTVTSYDQLISVIARYDPGKTVTLTILRAGQTKQVRVTFANRPPGNAN